MGMVHVDAAVRNPAEGLVVFGDDDAEPLLGATILASAGVEVDPRSRRLRKLPSVRLKELRRRRS